MNRKDTAMFSISMTCRSLLSPIAVLATGMLLGGAGSATAAGRTYGTAYPPVAAPFEGVWLIDLKSSGLPGMGKSPPKLTPWAADEQHKRELLRQKGDVAFDLTSHCSNPGMPRMMSLPWPIEVHAREGTVTILFEWNHLFRQIFVDGKPHEAVYSTAAGLSTGQWDQGTLLVKTTDRNDKTMLNDSIPNSDDMTLQEVFTVSPDGKKLDYQVSITDPKSLVEPWTRRYVFQKQASRELTQDACLDRVDAGQFSVPQGF